MPQPGTFPFPSPPERDDEPLHAELRRTCPVARMPLASGGEAYVVSRYRDVRQVFLDRAFSRAAATRPGVATLRPAPMSPHIMLSMDPPDHTRIRGLVNRAFTPRAVNRLRPRLREIAEQLVDDMVAAGPPVDFVSAFAAPLPALSVSEMLGVPAEDHRQLQGWMDVLMSITAHSRDEMRQASRDMLDYLGAEIERRRREPGDDLLSDLIAARDEGDRLSEAELAHNVYIILIGGYETTASLLANSLFTLDAHPDQRELMRTRPELIPQAVEEILRYVRISQAGLERVAVRDVELGGVTVPAGSTVITLKYSAHRDEELLPEPDRFDITRPEIPHLAFGLGPHHCIGAALARAELTIAYETLLRRLPGLRPALPPEQVEWKAGLITRGPERMPVQW
ncbi:cytochrome P450 [Micromonospora sp. HK10]|uniref:cytochrome P450 n=1 Tax=Micromonospora sp. HK10 TaxID=1538294 RepID=UPI000A5912A6|nr:cytochrome P450 [Micromonospora sp. HK10]